MSDDFEKWYKENGYYHDTVSDRKELMRETWYAALSPERESKLDDEVMRELMNAYNWAHRGNNYYSAKAEEIIIVNGGIVAGNQSEAVKSHE